MPSNAVDRCKAELQEEKDTLMKSLGGVQGMSAKNIPGAGDLLNQQGAAYRERISLLDAAINALDAVANAGDVAQVDMSGVYAEMRAGHEKEAEFLKSLEGYTKASAGKDAPSPAAHESKPAEPPDSASGRRSGIRAERE